MALKPTKAKPSQGKLKIGLYGRAGTGKTWTALTIAEMIAEEEKKRILFINTQPGDTDFYSMDVPQRKLHPKAFDFDIVQTKQLLEVRDFIPKIDTDKYCVLIIDSASHLWDAAVELWPAEKNTRAGQPPIHAYAVIKKPFRQMLDNARNCGLHVILCGREQNEFERHSADNWEFKGTRMRAEKETGHEPDITCQMTQERNLDTKEFVIYMYVEKDHSGLLQGESIRMPTAETFRPWYNLLNGIQHVPVQSLEEATELDMSTLAREEEDKATERATLFTSIRDSMMRSTETKQLEAAWSLTVGKKMKLGEDLYEELRIVKDSEKERLNKLSGLRIVKDTTTEKETK